jgi:hypothetical protein
MIPFLRLLRLTGVCTSHHHHGDRADNPTTMAAFLALAAALILFQALLFSGYRHVVQFGAIEPIWWLPSSLPGWPRGFASLWWA